MAARKPRPDSTPSAAPMPGLGLTALQRRMAGMSGPTRTTVPRRQKQTAGQKPMAGQRLTADQKPMAWLRTRTPMAAHSSQKQTVGLPFQRRTVYLWIQTPMADQKLMV